MNTLGNMGDNITMQEREDGSSIFFCMMKPAWGR